MATLSLRRARPADGPGEIVTLPEANGQSFHEGEFVYLVSGEVTACASDGVVILGMAMHDASTTRYTDCDVLLANPTQNFWMTSSEASAAALAITDRGVKYAIRVASNRTYVDASDTSYDALVIKKIPFDAIADGTINPEVVVSVIPAAFQGGAAAT